MSKTIYPIHPDFKFWSHMHPPIQKWMLPSMQSMMGLLFTREKSTEQLTVERKTIPLSDGATLRALLYTPTDLPANAPCLIYYHGGGFVFPAAPYHYTLAKLYSRKACCKVLFVDYRLAPKHPFPTPPNDCYAAYCWLLDHATELSVDPERIAVGGDSAGGKLATTVALLARDHGRKIPCGQLLLYPVISPPEKTESMRQFTDTPMCNSRDAKKYDALYMPDNAVQGPYATLLNGESLSQLPATYVETAEFDCLRDEGILYAQALEEAGIPTTLYNTEGTMHGYDIVLRSPIVWESIKRRILFLRECFHPKNGM